MSDIFSPARKASSSKTTSSVFQIITRSSKLGGQARHTQRVVQPRQRDGEARNTAQKTTAALALSDPAPQSMPYPRPCSKTTPGTPASASTPSPRKKQRRWHWHATLYLPPDKNVTGFLASEVVIVLQDDLVCVPHYHSKLISGRRKGDKEVRHGGQGKGQEGMG